MVPSPTPTRWTVHLERPTACHRITPFRTSCGRPDPVAGAVCRAMIGCVRHCGRNHPHGRAAGTTLSEEQMPSHTHTGKFSVVGVTARRLIWRMQTTVLKPERLIQRGDLPPIRTHSLVHLAVPIPCPRTILWRTSCDAHNQGQGVIGRQTVGITRRPVQRVRMGLGAAGRLGCSAAVFRRQGLP